jgi:hypothetical protein
LLTSKLFTAIIKGVSRFYDRAKEIIRPSPNTPEEALSLLGAENQDGPY